MGRPVGFDGSRGLGTQGADHGRVNILHCRLHRLFQQHQLDLVPEIELTSNDLLIDLARIGLGIAFIPDFCLTQHTHDLFIVETKEELPERELVIAYNEQLPLSPAAKEFLHYF